MAKYIDAEAFKAQLSDLRRQVNEIVPGMNIISTVSVSALLDDYPAADAVEVRHGHWRILYEANPYDLEAECSVCHNEVKMPTCMGKPIYSYCPHCAAKMDEVEKNEC